MVIYHTERALPDVVKFTTSGNGCYQGLRSNRLPEDRRLWERGWSESAQFLEEVEYYFQGILRSL